jgi:hypothetical protein
MKPEAVLSEASRRDARFDWPLYTDQLAPELDVILIPYLTQLGHE